MVNACVSFTRELFTVVGVHFMSILLIMSLVIVQEKNVKNNFYK